VPEALLEANAKLQTQQISTKSFAKYTEEMGTIFESQEYQCLTDFEFETKDQKHRKEAREVLKKNWISNPKSNNLDVKPAIFKISKFFTKVTPNIFRFGGESVSFTFLL
jgi:hypothetical protein